jgi:hypothetical protein
MRGFYNAIVTDDLADPDVLTVSGNSSSQRVTGPECASPVGLCTRGRMTGTITGEYRSVATELIPSSVPGVLYVRATTVITTDGGELTVEEHAVVNSSPEGFGEHTSLGEITGGTGVWAGASGYLHAVGDSSSGANTSTLSGKVRRMRS